MKNPRGFLLLEAAVAGAVLATVLATLVLGFTQAKAQQQGAINRMEAMYAAQDIMEGLHNVDYATLASVGSTPVPGKPNYSSTVTVTTQSLSSLSIAYAVKEVKVAVTYPGGQVSVTTLRAP